uniref:2,3-diphosphoglycerate-dependent phosphoglycerate mutase GpmB n=1 Tax=Candidatus Aschnera chinzeii TaxID=1485666 RepID=A0AAT9G4S6_9ENTR|nr:MAG: 2,3-diphosphoglycerate-dependent phosphoglycerate mutase GpmB [Candidatus Aschnera chinzeii]
MEYKYMLQIYLVRHGETEWNINDYIQGQSDSNLTEIGIKQINLVAKKMKYFGITHIISSDLGRAKKTANIISQLSGCDITYEPKLRELHMGILEGRAVNTLNHKEREWYKSLINGNIKTRIPNGETINELSQRMHDVLENCRFLPKNSIPVLVSHGIGLSILINRILGVPSNRKRRLRLRNCSISKIYYQDIQTKLFDGWFIETIGDISHLNTL